MANEIKLKRGSGSDPGASDLVVGEVAIRTDNGKLFTKKDNGSVAEITGGGGIDDGDKGDITVSNSGATFTIDNDAVTGAKIADDVALAGNPTTTTQSAGNDTTRIATTAFVTTADNLKMDLAGGSFVGDVTFAGTNYNIIFDKSDSLFRLNDDAKIAVGTGTGNDMEIFHESSSNVNEIRAIDGEIHIQADNFMLISDDTAGRAIYLDNSSGHLELGFDGNHCININGSQTEFVKDVKFDGGTAGRDITFDRSDNALEFADNAKAMFGAGDDLQIFHDGSDSFIANEGTGGLVLSANALTIKNKTRDENQAVFTSNSTVQLYNDNTIRLTTTTSGITVNGTATADAFSGPLTGNVTGNASGSSGSCTGNAATATALETARNIGGVSFDGTGNINLPGVNTSGNQDTSGNAATATKLATARTISGTSFDGSANITLNNSNITNGAGYITGSSLNASNLSSGTIPDGRFPATLPAISGANLTNLPASSDSTKLPLSGGELTGDLTTHVVKPDGNNSRSLGTASLRWSDVFTNDLHLSNKGGSNKIDNSWGDFTIQEGIEDLFLINNRNGKMYKFVLKEVG